MCFLKTRTGEVTDPSGRDQTSDSGTQQESAASTTNKDSSPAPESKEGGDLSGIDDAPQSPEKSAAGIYVIFVFVKSNFSKF